MSLVIRMASVAFSSICMACMADAKAKITFNEEGDRLWAHVRITGLVKGIAFPVRIEWKAPRVTYRHKDGSETVLFADSFIVPIRKAGDVRWTCVCSDTGEKGCARTRAYRTLVTTLKDGTVRRAAGIWRVAVKNDDTGSVLGEATYEVK